MDVIDRRELARRALDGYISGSDATSRATTRALAKVDNAVAVVLVEGISDQIALETAAVGRGRDLDAERVVIVPIGGAHAIDRFLTRLGPPGTRARLAGLCDLREEEIFRHLTSGRNVIMNCGARQPFVVAVESDNVVATRFHPEKSSDAGVTSSATGSRPSDPDSARASTVFTRITNDQKERIPEQERGY